MSHCPFCDIVSGKAPCHKIWESEKYLAFLSIFPNTKGFSVLIPKKHYPSNIFQLDNEFYSEFLLVAKEVANFLAEKLEVERCALIVEGMGVNHAHIKLIPLHGTKKQMWSCGEHQVERNLITSYSEERFTKYPGYVSSHDSIRAPDEELRKVAQSIRDN